MGKILVGSGAGAYAFDPIGKTVTLTGLPAINLEQLLLIVNVTRNVMLYNFADTGFSGTTESGNVITLISSLDTSAMAASDRLQVFVDIELPDNTGETPDWFTRLSVSTEDAQDDKPLVDFGLKTNDGDPEGVLPIPVMVDTTGWQLVTSGLTRNNLAKQFKVGDDGGTVMTDAPAPISFYLALTNAANVSPTFDTTGFQSFCINATGSMSNAYYGCEQSNDGLNWSYVCGWITGSASSVNANVYNPGLAVFPCVGKYLRIRCTTASANQYINAICYFRSAPMPMEWNSGVSGISAAGAAIATAGNPVLMAGSDGTNVQRMSTDVSGNVKVIGPQGVGQSATTYNPVKIASTDQQGLLRLLLLDTLGRVETNLPQANNANPGVAEALNLLLSEMRQLNFFIRQLPSYLNLGAVITDESKDFSEDPTFTS